MDLADPGTVSLFWSVYSVVAYVFGRVYQVCVRLYRFQTMDEAKALYAELKEIMQEDELPPRHGRHPPVSGPLGPLSFLGMEDLDEFNEVYPGIFIGKGTAAQNIQQLQELGITHVLNAAHGPKFAQINTDPTIYSAVGIEFLGLPAMDVAGYQISKHFDQGNDFIKMVLEKGGRVYVHCHQGRSRSAALVLAYLVKSHDLSIQDALKTVRDKRKVTPNEGFLRQLCQLQLDLKGRGTGGSGGTE